MSFGWAHQDPRETELYLRAWTKPRSDNSALTPLPLWLLGSSRRQPHTDSSKHKQVLFKCCGSRSEKGLLDSNYCKSSGWVATVNGAAFLLKICEIILSLGCPKMVLARGPGARIQPVKAMALLKLFTWLMKGFLPPALKVGVSMTAGPDCCCP